MKRLLSSVLRLGAIALLLALLVYMGGGFDPAGIEPGVEAAPPPGPAPAQEALVREVERTLWYEAVGTVRPRREVTVAPLVAGQLVEMRAEPGRVVQAGELLARLEARELEARLEQAKSARRAAEALARQARAHAARVTDLQAKNAATLEELEQAEAGRTRAEAELAAAEQRVLEAGAQADDARILAPLTGVVTARLAEPGDVVWPGKPLYLVHDPGDLRLEAGVREGLIAQVSVGSTLTVELTALGARVEATVDEIVPAADPTSRSFLVKAALPRREGLSSGMFGRLRVPTGSRRSLVVPRAAIRSIGQLDFTRVRTDSGWRRRYVTLGAELGADVVVLSGLAAGERVGWE